MRRREAAQLFSEICECVPDAFVNSISLMPSSRSKEEFDLRINVTLDAQSLSNVQSVVNKHGMNLKEDKGSLLIYGNQTRVNDMAIVV